MRNCNRGAHPEIRDYGAEPLVLPIRHAAIQNQNFRTALRTGMNLQLTLMSIPVHGDIGEEMHADIDQFIRIESGKAKLYWGCCQHSMHEVGCIGENDAILIPAGTWHNVVNIGAVPLKLTSLYAPPAHPADTVHMTKADAEH